MDVNSYVSSSSNVSEAEPATPSESPDAALPETRQSPLKIAKKRQRTTFSQAQLHVLEEAFTRQQYLVGSERLRLAGLLNIGVTQVKVWFQNRRIRWRREQRQMLSNAHHHRPLNVAPTTAMISMNPSSSTLTRASDPTKEEPTSPTSTDSYIVESFERES